MPVQRRENQGYEQEPNTNQHITMDSRIPTSHMIGNEHPTQAEFAAAMIGMGSSNQGVAMSGAGMQMPGMQGMQMPGMQGMQMPGMSGMQAPASEPTKNLYTYIVNEIKIPFVVAILFFIFSLPPIRIILSHYMPSLIRPTGEFHISGLLVISLTMGATFWLMHRVIAPLLSL
jgi:hypothetical protein